MVLVHASNNIWVDIKEPKYWIVRLAGEPITKRTVLLEGVRLGELTYLKELPVDPESEVCVYELTTPEGSVWVRWDPDTVYNQRQQDSLARILPKLCDNGSGRVTTKQILTIK